jgi:Domain of unknown function (DUF5134)
MTPAWLLDIFAALMIVVAVVSAARLGVARPWRGGRGAAMADIDVAHLLMAIAMAGMLAASLQTLPGGAWEVVFGVLTAWFAYRVIRDAQVSGIRALAGGHCAPHLIHAASMLYMFLALAAPMAHSPAGLSGMGAASAGTLKFPLLAYVFTLLLAGYSVWDLDQLSGPGTVGHYSLAAARVAPVPVLAGVGSGGGLAGPDAIVPGDPGSLPPSEGAGPADGRGRGVLAPWVAISCRIAMGVTMGFMLVIMI